LLTIFVNFLVMVKDFQQLIGQMNTGVIATSLNLRIIYANSHASLLLTDAVMDLEGRNFAEFQIYSSNQVLFEIEDCIRSQIVANTTNFHKTLIIKTEKTERLIYFSGNKVQGAEGEILLFTLADISGEMQCIVQSQPMLGGKQKYLANKIIGHHESIKEIFKKITLVAETGVNVMILGETGTGKELVAEAIHELSSRGNKPMVKVNCSALSESLLESELFGHVKGSFTGAFRDKAGKFELADGGTIFLDEIGEISLGLQVKLLRVIQEKTIERVGGTKSIKVDMRIVAATNKNLRELISKGQFREDLYYRLNVFSIEVPPLRNRSNDIPDLVRFFIELFNKTHSRNIKGINRQALKILMDYHWPGNIRELQNVIEHAFVLSESNLIGKDDLPADIKLPETKLKGTEMLTEDGNSVQGFSSGKVSKSRSGRLNISRDQLEAILAKNQWNQSRTAKTLGISRVALWKKMKTFELQVPSDIFPDF